MKIIQSNVTSINGMIAREDGEEDWLPSDGWDEFVDDAKRCGNFIMGREAYELVMKLYPDHNFDDVDVPYKIIVTAQAGYQAPDGYVAVNSPEAAIKFLEEKDAEVGLLVGGGKLNSSFYLKGLIDEAWITVDPYILGKGRPVIGACDFETKLKLIDVIRLSKDRVQLRYSVVKG
jgi:dihydrofolate reductase